MNLENIFKDYTNNVECFHSHLLHPTTRHLKVSIVLIPHHTHEYDHSSQCEGFPGPKDEEEGEE